MSWTTQRRIRKKSIKNIRRKSKKHLQKKVQKSVRKRRRGGAGFEETLISKEQKQTPEKTIDEAINTAKVKLTELNEQIKASMSKRCPGGPIQLSLDFVKDMNQAKEIVSFKYLEPHDLLLCLNHTSGCLASIRLDLLGNSLELSSKTHPSLEGKRYNTLLRCVVMILAPLFGVQKIVSNAIHTRSAYLMCRYFDGSIIDEEYREYQQSKSYYPMPLTSYEAFEQHIEDYKTHVEDKGSAVLSLLIESPVNQETQQKNEASFLHYVESAKCIPLQPETLDRG